MFEKNYCVSEGTGEQGGGNERGRTYVQRPRYSSAGIQETRARHEWGGQEDDEAEEECAGDGRRNDTQAVDWLCSFLGRALDRAATFL